MRSMQAWTPPADAQICSGVPTPPKTTDRVSVLLKRDPTLTPTATAFRGASATIMHKIWVASDITRIQTPLVTLVQSRNMTVPVEHELSVASSVSLFRRAFGNSHSLLIIKHVVDVFA